jgi:hypothetical protein
VRADRAEAAGVEARDVERAEAAHRGAADGDAVRIGVEPLDRCRDRLVQHVASPAAIRPVVEEAATTAARQEDRRRAIAESRQRGEELVRQQPVRRAAAPVQEHE